MKIRYYVVVIAAAFIFLSGCGNGGGETAEQSTEEHYLTPEEDAKNQTVMEEYSEDAEFPELASFLADYYKVPEEYMQETRYYYNYTDLNEDGISEIFAVVIGETTSSGKGDSALILSINEEKEFEVLEAFTGLHTPVLICDEMVNGWHMIVYPVYGGGQDAGYRICRYKEGEGYQSEESEFVEEPEWMPGIRILADNLINDMDEGDYLTLVPRDEVTEQ